MSRVSQSLENLIKNLLREKNLIIRGPVFEELRKTGDHRFIILWPESDHWKDSLQAAEQKIADIKHVFSVVGCSEKMLTRIRPVTERSHIKRRRRQEIRCWNFIGAVKGVSIQRWLEISRRGPMTEPQRLAA